MDTILNEPKKHEYGYQGADGKMYETFDEAKQSEIEREKQLALEKFEMLKQEKCINVTDVSFFQNGVITEIQSRLGERAPLINSYGLVKYNSDNKTLYLNNNGVRESIPNISINKITGQPMTYCFNDGVVSFIDEKGQSYITPYFDMVYILQSFGFKETQMLVPYANEAFVGISTTYRNKWENLLNNLNFTNEFEHESIGRTK